MLDAGRLDDQNCGSSAIKRLAVLQGHVLIMGDFNFPPDDEVIPLATTILSDFTSGLHKYSGLTLSLAFASWIEVSLSLIFKTHLCVPAGLASVEGRE